MANQNHIDALLSLMQLCSQNNLFHFIWKTWNFLLTFEQSGFKRDFVLNNQRKRENAKTTIKKGFYKLMNNANFGYGCKNNANNTKFQPIIDGVNEISYIKKYFRV